MTNEIDNKIQAVIEQQAGYILTVFRTRFNDGARDAVNVFQEVHSTFGRYMTRDYCTTVLGLLKRRVDEVAQNRVGA